MQPQTISADALYMECEGVIKATVWKFVKRHGGHFEDLFADASIYFMKGWAAITEGRHNTTNLKTEIMRWVWYELFDEYRTRSGVRRVSGCKEVATENMHLIATPNDFDLQDFVEGLSKDAAAIVSVLFNPPDCVTQEAEARGGKPCNYRSCIRKYFVTQGWDSMRVTSSFEEIGKALAG